MKRTSSLLLMKKFDVSTSKVILIILGVLVAIVIGFNSKAVGARNMGTIMKVSSEYALKIEKNDLISNATHKVVKTIRAVILD